MDCKKQAAEDGDEGEGRAGQTVRTKRQKMVTKVKEELDGL